MRFFKAILSFIGIPTDLDSIIKALGLAGATSVVIGILAKQVGEHAHWIAIAALATFVLMLMAWFYIIKIYRLTSVFGQVRVESLLPLREATGFNVGATRMSVSLQAMIKNHSDTPIFYKIKRINHSLQGKTRPSPITGAVNILQPKTDQATVFSTIDNIEVDKPIEGTFDLEVLYGTDKDNLPYLLTYEATPKIIVVKMPDNTAEVKTLAELKKAEHEKIGWFSW